MGSILERRPTILQIFKSQYMEIFQQIVLVLILHFSHSPKLVPFFIRSTYVNNLQVLHSLTTKEMMLLTPTSMITPRCLILKPQETLFVSGLCRIDLQKVCYTSYQELDKSVDSLEVKSVEAWSWGVFFFFLQAFLA